MMGPEKFFKLQFNLEGNDFDASGYSFQFKKVEGEYLPRLCVLDFGDNVKFYLARGLKPELEAQLRQLPPETLLYGQTQVEVILAQDQPCQEVGHFITYIFPDELNEGTDDEVIRFVEPHHPLLTVFGHGFDGCDGVPVFGLKQGDKIVSACVSSREDAFVGEAWVLTLPEYRGRGYAQRVVLAWQRDLKRQGKVPFYSHHQTNVASARLAQKMGLKKIYTQVSYF